MTSSAQSHSRGCAPAQVCPPCAAAATEISTPRRQWLAMGDSRRQFRRRSPGRKIAQCIRAAFVHQRERRSALPHRQVVVSPFDPLILYPVSRLLSHRAVRARQRSPSANVLHFPRPVECSQQENRISTSSRLRQISRDRESRGSPAIG